MLKFKNKLKFNNRFNSGFNLIETLVATGIFSVSVVSLLAILGSGTSNIIDAKNKMVAIYLAQEGVELTRNLRDNSVLENTTSNEEGWKDFKTIIDACITTDVEKYCTIRIGDSGITTEVCLSDTATPCEERKIMYRDHGYTHADVNSNGGTETIFIRNISAEKVNDDNEIIIDSTVNYKNYDITFSESLFNWR